MKCGRMEGMKSTYNVNYYTLDPQIHSWQPLTWTGYEFKEIGEGDKWYKRIKYAHVTFAYLLLSQSDGHKVYDIVTNKRIYDKLTPIIRRRGL